MKRKLTEFLACPNCKGDLDFESDLEATDLPWQEIIEGRLTCLKCNNHYPISQGIPRLLPGDQIQIEVQRTIDGFGYEWREFNHQIKNSYMSDRKNFLDFIHPIMEDFFKEKIILDAGCGMGRFLKLGAQFGSREIIGMDLSNSVVAAYQNTRSLPNAHVVQGDILSPPFKPRFDYIFSIGVLQFLAEPRSGFRSLTKLLRKGGTISIWVYSEENNQGVIRILSPIRKHITSRLPKPVLKIFCYILGAAQFAILKFIYKPMNELAILKKFARKLPKNDYLYYNSQLTYHELVSIIFDHLVPQLVVYLSREEITNWFNDEGLASIQISSRNNMSWRAHGVV